MADRCAFSSKSMRIYTIGQYLGVRVLEAQSSTKHQTKSQIQIKDGVLLLHAHDILPL